MDNETMLRQLMTHCAGLRTAAIAAGPEALVPTCPPWTVNKLIRHIARVHWYVLAAVRDPTGTNVTAPRAPLDWDSALSWWDEQRTALYEALSATPETPAWMPFSEYEPNIGSWIRRQAHEAAIHRLDAEFAAGSATVSFDPSFAADGIDELLVAMLPSTPRSEHTSAGSVLVHAKDVGRMWSLRIDERTPPASTEPEQPFEPDLTIEGDTADAVYRAVWGRPHGAVIRGDSTLLEPLAAP